MLYISRTVHAIVIQWYQPCVNLMVRYFFRPVMRLEFQISLGYLWEVYPNLSLPPSIDYANLKRLQCTRTSFFLLNLTLTIVSGSVKKIIAHLSFSLCIHIILGWLQYNSRVKSFFFVIFCVGNYIRKTISKYDSIFN